MRKKYPIVIAAVVAALCVTAAAAYVIQWNGKLAEHFHADKQQQSELVSAGAVAPVDQTVTQNGVTVTAVQTLGDKNGVYMLFDVKAPEGVTLSENNAFEHIGIKMDGVRCSNCSGGFISDTDDNNSPTCAVNERYFELWLNNTERTNWKGKTITLDFTNLQADKGKLDFVTAVEGQWELSWTLSYMDETKTFEINKAYDMNGHEVLVKSIELSPLSMTLDLGGDGLKQLVDDSDFNQCGCLCTLSLTMRDGTALNNVIGPGGENFTGTSYTRTTSFDKVLDVGQVTGFTLTFPWEKANNTLTVTLP